MFSETVPEPVVKVPFPSWEKFFPEARVVSPFRVTLPVPVVKVLEPDMVVLPAKPMPPEPD